MRRGPSGSQRAVSTVGGERVLAFVPTPLPPVPNLAIDPPLREKIDEALLALGRLDSVTALLPDPHLFLYAYIRKEAVVSSQIEGTQSSLWDLLVYEASGAPGVPIDDVIEVTRYVAALEHGLARIRGAFPLSNRLLREIHGILLAQGRGADKTPGEFRRSQNWIGGSRPGDASFVPPPPEVVAECMGSLERWLHDDPVRTPPLLKAALAHVQFETIHPFLDGNGRLGRLLVTLLLVTEGVLHEPLLYLSLYLKQHRTRYYTLLDVVRIEGDWEQWLGFFVDGVRETAAGAVATVRRLVELFQADRIIVTAIGRTASSALRVHRALQERPVASIADIAARSGLTVPTVTTALDALGERGLTREITGRRKRRLFAYSQYLAILSEGTEPIPR